MILSTRAVFLLLFIPFLAAPASAGLFDDDEARQQIAALRAQQQQLVAQIERLEAVVSNQRLFDLGNQLQQIAADLAITRGEIELHSHQLKGLETRQKDLYVDLDARLSPLEPRVADPLSDSAAENESAASSTAQSPTEPSSGDENADYEKAISQFRAGHYQAARKALEAFQRRYPAGGLVANAQYWIGSSYVAQHDYRQAYKALKKLLLEHPKSAKIPDALLTIATVQKELGQSQAARQTLERLVEQYPLSNATIQAKRRLAK